MNKSELEMHLKNNGATYLERVTHFEGDAGRWIVKNQNHEEIKTPLHPNELVSRISTLNLQLRDTEHPSWQREREAFEEANAADSERGGGFAYNAAFNRWAQLSEIPGENLKLILWARREQ